MKFASHSNPNKKVFESNSIVKHYLGQENLYPAEQGIYRVLADQLSSMRMLDIGMGGGRTTLHFAEKVREYFGVDYSSPLVEGCRTKFSKLAGNITFACMDVRDLSEFGNASFDFILFSYNGLDYIVPEDRSMAMKEMRRLLKPGGYLCFSSHNLPGYGRNRFAIFSQPVQWIRRALILTILRILNGNPITVRSRAFAMIRDDGLRFRLKLYYTSPSKERILLADLGLEQSQMFGMDGRSIQVETDDKQIHDDWIYFLSRAPLK